MQEGNGAVNVSAVKIAKEASIPKFVYVSVASIVKDVVGNVLLKGYVLPIIMMCSLRLSLHYLWIDDLKH